MKILEESKQIIIGNRYYSLLYILEENHSDYISYGIRVIMLDLSNSSSLIAAVNDITTEVHTAHEMFIKIVSGAVTPITLKYVIEDLICECNLSKTALKKVI